MPFNLFFPSPASGRDKNYANIGGGRRATQFVA
jgi:hypothetical protein